MKKIQELYEVERQARQEKLSPSDRKQLRLEESLPVLETGLRAFSTSLAISHAKPFDRVQDPNRIHLQ